MTIDVNGDYAVDAGQVATFDLLADGAPAYDLASSSLLTIFGAVTIGDSTAGAAAYGVVAEDIDAALHIGVGGSFTLSATGAGSSGYGFYAGADQASFSNDGTFILSAAFGPAAVSFNGSGTFSNTGEITITGLDGFATGVFGAGPVEGGNAGAFSITGPLDTEAFRLIGGGAFTNSGQITATSSSHASYGIIGDDTSGGAITITNMGTITADTAISDDNQAGSVVLINSGIIDGDIALGNGSGGSVTNTGQIHGDVLFSGLTGAELYDGRGGSLTGHITLAGGSDTVYLGNDGETVMTAADATNSSVTIFGGTGNDSIAGGPGADLLDGGGGADTLTGGLGADTFVYRPGDGTVTITDFSGTQGDLIDLSQLGLFLNLGDVLANASQVGPDTVIALGSGSLKLQGAAMGSLTDADFKFSVGPSVGPGIGGTPTTGSGTVNGTSGDDWLQGGGGADTLHGGAGSDYLDGGAGLNTALYDGAYRQYAVSAAAGTINGGPEGGTDVLTNIQRIQFVDGYLATSPTDTAGQVYRVYEATLGRAPDQEGLTNWVTQLNSGASLQSVVDGFVGSQEFQNDYGANLSNSAFVTLLYENVLHRDPDSGGLANWVADLNGGMTRAQVVTGFSESQEDVNDLSGPVQQGLWIGDAAAGEVARLYDAVLGRLPDGSGLANWTHSLESGATLQSVADGFVGSQEFQTVYGSLDNSDFVTLLYHNVLHRDPDAGGLSNWVTALSSGTESRAQVVVGFSESAEHIGAMAPYIDGGVWLA